MLGGAHGVAEDHGCSVGALPCYRNEARVPDAALINPVTSASPSQSLSLWYSGGGVGHRPPSGHWKISSHAHPFHQGYEELWLFPPLTEPEVSLLPSNQHPSFQPTSSDPSNHLPSFILHPPSIQFHEGTHPSNITHPSLHPLSLPLVRETGINAKNKDPGTCQEWAAEGSAVKVNGIHSVSLRPTDGGLTQGTGPSRGSVSSSLKWT